MTVAQEAMKTATAFEHAVIEQLSVGGKRVIAVPTKISGEFINELVKVESKHRQVSKKSDFFNSLSKEAKGLKVGVLYVRKGQKSTQDWFCNSESSTHAMIY